MYHQLPQSRVYNRCADWGLLPDRAQRACKPHERSSENDRWIHAGDDDESVPKGILSATAAS